MLADAEVAEGRPPASTGHAPSENFCCARVSSLSCLRSCCQSSAPALPAAGVSDAAMLQLEQRLVKRVAAVETELGSVRGEVSGVDELCRTTSEEVEKLRAKLAAVEAAGSGEDTSLGLGDMLDEQHRHFTGVSVELEGKLLVKFSLGKVPGCFLNFFLRFC